MERGERRGSLGRALEKLRAAMKRRGSSSKSVPTVASTPIAQEQLSTTREAEEPATSGSLVDAPPHIGDFTAEVRPTLPTDPNSLLVDDGELLEVDDNHNDSGKALLPIISSRSGISEEKSHQLFEKYGLTYEPRVKRSEEQEPPGKVRRVEKPVRIRIHWLCHECNSHFARDRTCASCGHRRCRECTRNPPKKVRQIIGSMKQTKEHDDQPEAMPPATTKETIAPVASETLDEYTVATLLLAAPSQSLKKDDHEGEHDSPAAEGYKLAMQARPRSGHDLVLRPKSQIIRRSCHKCEMQFIPASRTECEHCQHTRCILCPRYPAKSEKWPMGSPGDEQAPADEARMVRTVQRVYKKPRQRVRYICDQCQTVFVDAERCRQCGHQRCNHCTRNP